MHLNAGRFERPRCDEAEARLAILGEGAVPGGRADHIAIAVMRKDGGVPDVGDLIGHVDLDLPARGRAALIVHDDVAVEAAAPGIDQVEFGIEGA